MPKLKIPRIGLRLKVTGMVTLLLTLILGVFVYAFTESYAGQLRINLFSQADQYSQLATTPIGDTYVNYKDSGTIRITQQIDNFLTISDVVSEVYVIGVDGTMLYSRSSISSIPSLSLQAIQDVRTSYLVSNNSAVDYVISPYLEDSGAHRYTIAYKINSEPVDKAISNALTRQVAMGSIGIVFTAYLVNLLLEFLLIRPINRLRQAALAVTSGTTSKRIQLRLNRNDELGDLAKSVSLMSSKLQDDIGALQELDKSKSEFMSLASHYLRTPITILNGSIEALDQLKQEHNQQIDLMLSNASNAAADLNELTENMLIIANLATGSTGMELNITNPKELLSTLVEKYQYKAQKKNINFNYENTAENQQLDVSSPHIRRAIENVLSNSLKFTDTGSINVSVSHDSTNLQVVISDTGSGIAANKIDSVFKGFKLGNDYMKMSNSGTGLGLYMTKLILEKHYGSIALKSTVNEGTTVSILIPLHESSPALTYSPNFEK